MPNTNSDLTALLAAQEKQIAALKAQIEAQNDKGKLTLGVGPNGTICVYGMSSKGFPLSLYLQRVPDVVKLLQDELAKWLATKPYHTPKKKPDGTMTDRVRVALFKGDDIRTPYPADFNPLG